ncbi:MAG: hypothetical protein A2X49_09520 [Lentisphaerae bacterium GWF2_52_8]|nr:MAG: hypothetical protein A2X49_09520 [Lentisphaerae bacterium GWF2_52_8]
MKGYLSNAFQNECAAHVKYLLFAKDAEEKSLPGLAKLFRAAADAEFFHARNHLNALDGIKTAWENLQSSRERESYEIESMYKEYLDYASEKGWSLAMYSFHDALEAEKIHHRLFSEAIAAGEGKDIEISRYFTCSSCGQTFKSDSAPLHCPVCGAPHDKIREVE